MNTKSKESKQSRIFSAEQAAHIFYRDLGICNFNGKSLWILDSGIINYEPPVVDHVIPFSKGGKTDVANGVLLGSNINYLLKDINGKKYQYVFGWPDWLYYYYNNDVISSNTQKLLIRNLKLTEGDWYFNHALTLFFDAINYLRFPIKTNGKSKKRDDKYFLSAAMKPLEKWKKEFQNKDLSFEERGLVSENPDPDIKILLQVREAKNIEDLTKLLKKIFPYVEYYYKVREEFYKAWDALFYTKELIYCDSEKECQSLISKTYSITEKLLNDKLLVPRAKNNFRKNVDFMKKFIFELYKSRITTIKSVM